MDPLYLFQIVKYHCKLIKTHNIHKNNNIQKTHKHKTHMISNLTWKYKDEIHHSLIIFMWSIKRWRKNVFELSNIKIRIYRTYVRKSNHYSLSINNFIFDICFHAPSMLWTDFDQYTLSNSEHLLPRTWGMNQQYGYQKHLPNHLRQKYVHLLQ